MPAEWKRRQKYVVERIVADIFFLNIFQKTREELFCKILVLILLKSLEVSSARFQAEKNKYDEIE